MVDGIWLIVFVLKLRDTSWIELYGQVQARQDPECWGADGTVELVGNRTECGLLQMATALGADYEAIRREGRMLRMFPFSSERKRMTSVVSQPGSRSALSMPCVQP